MRLLPLVLAAIAAFAAAAPAQTVITSVPFTINASGKYRLGNNLVTASAAQTAITINAPNVILDLGGFFVSGPANSTTSDQSVITVANVSNVTIRNGTVANNGYGIFFVSGANGINHLVENVNVTRCLREGITFGTSASSIVRECTVSQIGGYTAGPILGAGVSCTAGVRVESCFVNSVSGGTSGGTTFGGFGIAMSTGCFAIGNTVTNCAIGVSGGKYQFNLTANCSTPFSGGVNVSNNN